MAKASTIMVDCANAPGDGAFGNANNSFGISQALASLCNELAPVKTWGWLACLLGLSERTAQHRLAGAREFTADELATLLRSEHGLEFLSTIMGDARPKWWRTVTPLLELADAQRMQIEARRKVRRVLEAATDADLSVSRSIETAELALAVRGANKDSVVAPKTVSGLGLRRRTVAKV